VSLFIPHFSIRAVLKRQTPSIFLLFFWAISNWNLDRIPIVHPDEPWILSPGYKLFTQGVYGSDLFAGFNGMEHVYFEFMPLMSLLQGASAALLGVGVMQMRIVPVMLGAITLALSFALARRIANATTGVMTMFLLLFWQWAMSGTRLYRNFLSKLAAGNADERPHLGRAAILAGDAAARVSRDDFAVLSLEPTPQPAPSRVRRGINTN
jgi:hypothetical protein